MPVYQAWGVTCDGCGAELLLQYDTEEAARAGAASFGWHISPCAKAALCDDCDGESS